MKTASLNQTTDPQALAEEDEAVQRLLTDGTPIPEHIARRIDERADEITERIRRTHGVIDDKTFQSLLSDDDDA
jgi:hypothetical protein